MNRDKNANEYYEHFPYMSYEEILEVKRRKRRRRKSVVAGLGLMFVCTVLAVIVGIKVSGRSLISWLDPDEPAEGSTTGITGSTVSSEDPGFNLEQSPETGQTSGFIAWDVSSIVKVARKSVVGITCEQYASFTQTSSGSGIIMSEEGYVVTNYHVISNGDSISVTLDDGTAYPAFLVGADSFTDLAVLKVDATGLHPALFGDSDLVEAGQAAIAIGNPTGMLTGTVTMGIISAVNRDIMINNNVMNLIQTDASINSGNSGGPLLNQYGQVVGVTSVKINAVGYEGLGFAIPINTVKPIVEQLVEKGYVSGRPLVGIYGQEISKIASLFNNIPQGLMVNEIAIDSDAYIQGVRPGDIVTSVNGEQVTGLSRACEQRNRYTAGDKITITVYRSGKTVELSVELMEQNQETTGLNF